MANDPSTLYAGRIDTADPTNYPFGKAQNSLTDGDGVGTPYDADDRNDTFGFYQALLGAAGLTPSGSPETAVASQYLDAIQQLSGLQIFIADGTFLTPPWAKRLTMTVVGGGGGAGFGSFNDLVGSGGGGAGGTCVVTLFDPAPSYDIVIGLGGAEAPNESSFGSDGGTTVVTQTGGVGVVSCTGGFGAASTDVLSFPNGYAEGGGGGSTAPNTDAQNANTWYVSYDGLRGESGGQIADVAGDIGATFGAGARTIGPNGRVLYPGLPANTFAQGGAGGDGSLDGVGFPGGDGLVMVQWGLL